MYEFFRPILEFNNPVAYAIPFFFLLMGIEIYLNWRDRSENYVFKDAVASLGMGVGSIFSDLIPKSFAFIVFTHLYDNFGFFKEELSFTALGWFLLLLGDDFSYYWHHRTSHQVRLFWAAHIAHHSSQHYHLATALRQSWGEMWYKYSFYLWLAFLGFEPIMILTQISISLIYQFWIHTVYIKKLPWIFEFIFNTPSHHRVHHSSDIEYLDKNHGGILIIWDRLFGTFKAEEKPIKYGITTNINTYNPFRIATHELVSIWQDIKKAPTFKAKLGYIFCAPGWSHDGSTQVAKVIQAQYAAYLKENPNGTEAAFLASLEKETKNEQKTELPFIKN